MTAKLGSFAKVRLDHAAETSEDYVEAILRLAGTGTDYSCDCAPKARTVQLARHFEVAQPTVTKVLSRLTDQGLVCVHKRLYVHLTAKGAELAMESLSKHKLLVDFLVGIGVSAYQAELDAEGIEHHVSEETLSALQALLARQIMIDPS